MNEKLKYHFGDAPIVWVPFWGISKLRRRGGGFAGEIPGHLCDYDSWYAHALSEEVIAELAEIGFNLAVLPFSLGGSLEFEQEEHDDFERAAAICHHHGIKVLPYLQYQNLMQENNSPPDVVWSENLDGTPTKYTYYRRTACQSGVAFRRYLKARITEAMGRGADGIWIDNTYLKPCRCRLCRAGFTEYLKTSQPQILETLHLDPEMVDLPGSPLNTDPIARAFFDFNIERNIGLLTEFKTALEECGENALFCSNSMLYRGADYSRKGVDFYRFLALHDLVYLENKLIPGRPDGLPSGNFHGFTASSSAGTRAVSGSWKKGDFDSTTGQGSTRMPCPDEVDARLLEPVVFNGVSGAFWAVREMPDEYCRNGADKMKLYFEYPPMARQLRQTLAYIKTLPLSGDRCNAADIGVLYHSKSLAYDFVHHQEALFGIEKLLAADNFPYRVIFSETWNDVETCKLLILPGVRVLSRGDLERLEILAGGGMKILLLGMDCGIFDENNLRRLDSPFPGFSVYDHQEQAVENDNFIGFPDPGRTTPVPSMMSTDPAIRYPEFIERRSELAALVERLAPRRYRVNGDVVSTLYRDGGKQMLQLFSYDMPLRPQSVKVSFNRPGCGVLYRPEHPVETWSGREVVIPDFQRHALLSFDGTDKK